MTYRETTEYLFNQLPMFERNGAKGYKSGLDNTLSLDVHFGHPHCSYKTIHVAAPTARALAQVLLPLCCRRLATRWDFTHRPILWISGSA